VYVPFQEFGQNPLVSVIMGCLQFLKDGEGNAKEERQIHHHISHVTGACFKITPYYPVIDLLKSPIYPNMIGRS
jgi:hypothetical protein